MATNALAEEILRHLGVRQDKVQAVLGLSVKQVVQRVLRNQGLQASEWGDVDAFVTQCATRVLETVLQEMRRLRSDPHKFEQGRPMGLEVLDWLQEENLRTYAPLFIYHRLDSLVYVARLTPEVLRQLVDEHAKIYRNGQKGAVGGDFQKISLALHKLVHKTPASFLGLIGASPDERTLPLSERLDNYRDTEASALAIVTSGNGLELLHSKSVPRWSWAIFWTAVAAAIFFFTRFPGLEAWFDTEFGRLECAIARVKILVCVAYI